MPIYPALALLLGSALASEHRWLRTSTKVLATVCSAAAMLIAFVLFKLRGLGAPGDISRALERHPDVYTLSLGHMSDLTLGAFAYLRTPLMLAAFALAIGAAGGWMLKQRFALLSFAAMMVLFCHASRSALVVFDPYLSSRPLAEALQHAAPGQLIIDGEYYTYSSVFFYADRTALLLNGRRNNLEYGSYAPNAPRVFIDNTEFARLWSGASRLYLVTDKSRLQALGATVAVEHLYPVAESGGKLLLTNSAVDDSPHAELLKDVGTLW